MKKLMLIMLLLAGVACKKEKVMVVPVQKTLNGTTWKKYEFRSGDRDVHKILSFRAPDIINISVRDDKGYLFANIQEEYKYLYEDPNVIVFGPFTVPFSGIISGNQMVFQGETFVKSN